MPGADLPWALVALWRALRAGDDTKARAIHEPLVSLISMLPNLDAFLAVEKFLLQHQGIFRNTRIRGPVGYHLDATTAQEILAWSSDCGRLVLERRDTLSRTSANV